MERIEELCCYYIALIRAVYLMHQNHHWITKGKNFYGNHLLFERIYKSAAEDADMAAEKFIGLFGTETLDLHMQAQMIGRILENFSSGDPVQTSLEAEKKFLDFSEKFYTLLDKEDRLTLGLDDMIMSIASNREGAVYLLKQTSEGEDKMDSKMAARKKFLQRIKDAQDAGVTEQDRQVELNAFNYLKILVSTALTNMVAKDKKGGAAAFKTVVNRVGDQKKEYTYQVLIAKGSPEEKYAEQLQAKLPELINSIPYFANKQVQATVNMVDSL